MKIAFAAIALCMAPVVGFAADLPGRKAASAPGQAPAAFTWTGPYAGLNAGWGFGTVKSQEADSDIKLKGGLGGLQVGYNNQIGNLLIGLEADYALAHVNGDRSFAESGIIFGAPYTAKASVESKLESLGTVRARAGFIMNSALFYATGGPAFGRTKVQGSLRGTYTIRGVTSSFSESYSESKAMNGWVVGGGVEYAVTSNISGKLEYMYADLGKKFFASGTDLETRVSTKVNIIRAGVNYRF